MHNLSATQIRSLEEFEGEILTQHIDDSGQVWVEKWCSRQHSIAVRTTVKRINRYLNQEITLNKLLFGYRQPLTLVERHQHQVTYREILAVELPAEYFPRAQTYHEAQLRPLNFR